MFLFFRLTKVFRRPVNNGPGARVLRLVAALALCALVPVAACAYTVVLRSGRRVEIPPTFVVTSQTLTYEAAPGINITLLMNSIDIEATESANNEMAGSLLRRAQMSASLPTAPATSSGTSATSAAPPQARRTLTNRDLEASQRARLKSEADYERRRIQLGLPPLDELRRRNAEEARRAREQLQQDESEETQAEGYWRERSSAMRAEVAALDAEIDYLRGRLAADSDYIQTPYTSVTTVVPTFQPGRSGGFQRFGGFQQPVLTGNPGFIHAVGTGLQVSGLIGFGGGLSRSQVVLNARPGVPLVAPPVIVGSSVFGPPLATYSAGPLGNYYYPSYQREALIARLQEAEATRAGLQARWRLLEDEARRAGAQPGWLRP
jgi:hypothetical protein